MGGVLIKGFSALRIGAASLTASVSFFLISNFAVWMVWRDMYPKSFTGLITCYVAGLPFFRAEVVSDLLFCGTFFGIAYLVSQHATEPVSVPVSRNLR